LALTALPIHFHNFNTFEADKDLDLKNGSQDFGMRIDLSLPGMGHFGDAISVMDVSAMNFRSLTHSVNPAQFL